MRNYLSGLHNYHSSEFIPGTIDEVQNTPQKCSHGLYAEQLSGAAFTVARASNLHSWLYRILPSVCHAPFKQVSVTPLEAVTADTGNRANPTVFNNAPIGSSGSGSDSGLVDWNVASYFHPPQTVTTPNQLRWNPFVPGPKDEGKTFVTGLQTICGSGT